MNNTKKQTFLLTACGAGVAFCLGMYFYSSNQAENLQANIFSQPEAASYETVDLNEILPGVHEAAEEIKKPNVVLKGSVDKAEAAAGEEVTYSITVHNRDEKRYDNVQATALFPFDFLDFIEAKGLKTIDSQNQSLVFEKESLAGGEIWIINVRAKIKESVSGNMRISNAVTVSANGGDLSELYNYSETMVVPKPQPKALVTSGGLTTSISLLLIGFFSLLCSLRSRRSVFLEK